MSLEVNFPDFLDYLEQTRPATDAVAFQRRGYGQTDGLLRPARISYDKVSGEGIQSSLHTFH